MGRHRAPAPSTPRSVVAVVVATAGVLSISDSGTFQVANASELSQPLPVAPADAASQLRIPALGEALSAPSAIVRHGQELTRAVPVLPVPKPPVKVAEKPAPAPQRVVPRPVTKAAPKVVRATPVSDLVAAARGFLGVKYRYGGKTSSALDCSGLVFLALKNAGLSQPYRTSGALREWTVSIPKSQARAGDLVFGPGHVGIYLGDGMMIDAPHTGSSVGVRKVYANMTSYGRIPA